MKYLHIKGLALVATLVGASMDAKAHTPEPRVISIDVGGASTPRDRMAEFSVGADYPGTTIRPEALAQLKTARDELGFRYIRFHDIFHDDMGVYREVDGRPVYDCIDDACFVPGRMHAAGHF